jgi:Fibronectin type III domain
VVPLIQVTPGSIGYGTILSGMSVTNSFAVQNIGTGTLSGTASVGAPFSIVSGGSYSLGANASQTVTVVFSPTTAGNYNQNVSFSGGGGAIVTVSGSVTNASSVTLSPTIVTKKVTDNITNLVTLQFTTNLSSPTWQTIGALTGSTNLSFTNLPAVFIRGVCINLTGSVTLTWQPSTDPAVAGYKIYYGVASHTYTQVVTVGNVTKATIPNLAGGVVYYFVIDAYYSSGKVVPYSSEISAAPQTPAFLLTIASP